MIQCGIFGRCGGCSAQHIPYNVQLENKKMRLKKICGLDVQLFSGTEYSYRNRMDFIFHPDGLGFRQKGKWWKVVDVETCPISEKKLNFLLGEIRDFFRGVDCFDLRKQTGTYRYAVIRTPRDSSCITFVLNSESAEQESAELKIRKFADTTSADNVLVARVPPLSDLSISDDYSVIKGSEMLQETFLNKSFLFHSQGFFQNNAEMAEQLQTYVHDVLQKHKTKDADLLDLYGGVGTFGIVNSELFRQVSIVEGDKQCILAAEENIKRNACNCQAVHLDDRSLGRLKFGSRLFVITDPPRSGMHPRAIDALNKLCPEVIIYISCNPSQLEKDLPKFKRYSVKSAAVFDFFPQTPHMECVVVIS